MQSNYSELPNVMSVADAKAFAARSYTPSAHWLIYRGTTYATPKHHESNSGPVAETRSLSVNTELHYRGTTYITGAPVIIPPQSNRVAKQQLIYRGATYLV